MFDGAARTSNQDLTVFHFSPENIDIAVNRLKKNSPRNSAAGILSAQQKYIFVGIVLAIISALIAFPAVTFVFLNILLTCYFITAIAYRLFLMIISNEACSSDMRAIKKLNPSELPTITILAPLYKDAEALASLAYSLDLLEYPEEKKDIKLLLEKDDHETLNEARRLGLHKRYEILVAPEAGPKTKPKACNIGLQFARGEIVVIYDAEDQPEKDQLIKAAKAFRTADDNVACYQAKLNYYNRTDTWLTRLFTLEYSLWFDWLLPALQKLNAPIPLGGTSNFFRKDILVKVGAWDPFNVTEDADLGLRLSKFGYRVEMLDSTTYEEATSELGNWIRQRSRWIKGHLQTWLVHMRAPQDIVKTTGRHGLISIQFFLAGNVFSALINPLLWAAFIVFQFTSFSALEGLVPPFLQALNVSALIIGNLCFAVCAVVAPLKRGWVNLCIFGLTAPIYWFLTSVAAYKALWQIIVKPYYWEKTHHTVSRVAVERRKVALSHVDIN